MALQFDLVVIGSGPGGYVAAIRAAQLGLKVGVVERESLGGICLNWGCIPTKALLKTAQVYEYLQHAQDYGLTVQGAGFDFEAVIKRSRGVADGMSKGINFLFKKNKIEVVNGTGKLLAPGKVEVTKADGTKETVEAKSIILATGARARQLPNLPIDDKKIIGYRKAMTPDSLPKSMVVVGSGAIGVEFAYFYRSMGTEVTIVEYLPRIVPVEDEEVSRQMEKSYKKLGINILTNAEVTKVDTSGAGCNVFIKTAKGEQQIACDVVLSAVGVQTNLENLGLEELGIKVEKGRVLVDNFYQTNVPGIFAIGDIVPGPALAHVASAEGIIAWRKSRVTTPSRSITRTSPAAPMPSPKLPA
jgi:dihydrolipoamide dehydrogenase